MTIVERQAPFQLHRIGLVMEPEPGDPYEAWGVLNPASARGKDGNLYIFPRIVAEGNYSRIGIARVEFDDAGDPVGVTRLGYVLEPEEEYERSERVRGGVEDPRITWVEPLGVWVMAYTAVSAFGPQIALAISDDLFHWERLGPLSYESTDGVNFSQYINKDGMLFPDTVLDGEGRPALAVLHRPRYLVPHPDGTVLLEVPNGVKDERESIWIAYISLDAAKHDIRNLCHVYGNQLLAAPVEPWESMKIGGGTAPIRIPQGWLTFYHGVSGRPPSAALEKDVRYYAGVLVLDAERPDTILYRSKMPVLAPDEHEGEGIVPNVVFPTAVDCRGGGRLDVYYGMADSRIGVATTSLPGPDWQP